ncbi:MAG: hypothetical protein BroJett040_03420 [Oligoflexia bacterium]|nr:MAG: hypothetical protein BroJett040_03420 [Oligoflexia bacterium]
MEKSVLKSLRTLTLISIFTLSSCSIQTGSDSATPIAPYQIVSGTFSAATANLLNGTGTVRFQDSIGAIYSNISVSLSCILNNNGSNLTLVTHASNPSLTDGVHISFTRSGLNVSGSIQVNSSTVSSIQSYALAVLDPTNLNLMIDIRNQAPIRILVWTTGASYTISTANINSSTDVSPALTTSTGGGAYWGLIMTDTQLSQTQLGAANASP